MKFVRDVVQDAKQAASDLSSNVHEKLETAGRVTKRAAASAGAFALRACAACCLLAGLTVFFLCSAATTYAALYWAAIPEPLHAVPVHFDFASPTGHPLAEVNLVNKQWAYAPALVNGSNPLPDGESERERARPGKPVCCCAWSLVFAIIKSRAWLLAPFANAAIYAC